MHRKEEHSATLGSLSKLVLLITRKAAELKAFGIGNAILTVAVNHIEHPIITGAQHTDIQQLFTNVELLLHSANHQHTLIIHRQNIAEGRTFFHRFPLLDTIPGKTFLVYVEGFIFHSSFRSRHGLKRCQLRSARPSLTVFLTQILKPAYGITRKLRQVLAGLLNFRLKPRNMH